MSLSRSKADKAQNLASTTSLISTFPSSSALLSLSATLLSGPGRVRIGRHGHHNRLQRAPSATRCASGEETSHHGCHRWLSEGGIPDRPSRPPPFSLATTLELTGCHRTRTSPVCIENSKTLDRPTSRLHNQERRIAELQRGNHAYSRTEIEKTSTPMRNR